MKNNLIFSIFLFLLIGCSNNPELKKLTILKQLLSGYELPQRTVVLIIPFDGCSSCFEAAVSLIPQVTDKKGVTIIPDRHAKRVTNFINENGFSEERILIDSLQLTILDNLIETNPKIFILYKNSIEYENNVNIEELDNISKNVFNTYTP